LGILLAEKALRNEGSDFCSSITLHLDETLKELEVQSRETALFATNKIKGKWFSKKLFFLKIKKRNFDIGLNDGLITPFSVLGMPVCENSELKSLAIPDWDSISKYGFVVKLKIEPREWEKNKVLKIVYPKKESRKRRLEPKIHFPVLMHYIKNDAKSRRNIILE
jgi:hypothetical protein